MDGLRANPHVGFNHEKTMDKIPDTFSVFKDKKGARKGNPRDEIPDDGVDFSVPEDEEPPKPPEAEEQGEAPEYEEMIDGPLPAKGLGAGPKYLGKPARNHFPLTSGKSCLNLWKFKLFSGFNQSRCLINTPKPLSQKTSQSSRKRPLDMQWSRTRVGVVCARPPSFSLFLFVYHHTLSR